MPAKKASELMDQEEKAKVEVATEAPPTTTKIVEKAEEPEEPQAEKKKKPETTKSIMSRLSRFIKKTASAKAIQTNLTEEEFEKAQNDRARLLMARLGSVTSVQRYERESRRQWRFELLAIEQGTWYPGIMAPKSKQQQDIELMIKG